MRTLIGTILGSIGLWALIERALGFALSGWGALGFMLAGAVFWVWDIHCNLREQEEFKQALLERLQEEAENQEAEEAIRRYMTLHGGGYPN